MPRHIMKHKTLPGKRFKAPKIRPTAGTIAGTILLTITRGAIVTRAARQVIRERRRAWEAYAASIQKELDAERSRDWGFRAIDGRRIDF